MTIYTRQHDVSISMIPAQAVSPLFPYTTLFRSLGFGMLMSTLSVNGTIVTHRRFDPDQMLRDIETHRATVLTGVPLMLQRLDRKSTRLNSSHLVISYAVFCLKKKIKC